MEKALDILEIFGHHLDSVKQIMDDKDFMQDLLGILELEDNQILSDKAAAVFRSITDHPSGIAVDYKYAHCVN